MNKFYDEKKNTKKNKSISTKSSLQQRKMVYSKGSKMVNKNERKLKQKTMR